MITHQDLGLIPEIVKQGLRGIELRFQRENVLEPSASMGPSIAERQIADVHAMDRSPAPDQPSQVKPA